MAVSNNSSVLFNCSIQGCAIADKRQNNRGQEESPTKTSLPSYDAKCYLCPGNTRAAGDANPQYDHIFIFVNDYSAVKESQASYEPADDKGALINKISSMWI